MIKWKPLKWSAITVSSLLHAMLFPGILGVVFVIGDYTQPYILLSTKDKVKVYKRYWGYVFSGGSELVVTEQSKIIPNILFIKYYKKCSDRDSPGFCDPEYSEVELSATEIVLGLHYIPTSEKQLKIKR